MSLSSVAYLCFFILLSNTTSSLNEGQVTFISGGQVLTNPLLTLLNPGMSEVNFDQQGFSVLEVSHLFEYLNQQSRPLEFSNERDVLSYSLLLRFADSLKSQSLFEFVAHDFYHLLGTCLFNYIHKIPEIRSESFAPILFRVYLNLSSNSSLEERVRVFSSAMNSVRPDFYCFEEFFSHFDYTVLRVILSDDLKVTIWTLEIAGRVKTSFLIGNYDSEEWHLKFVDGNPHFELAKFLATNSTGIGSFDLAFLFSALERRHLLTLKEKETALRIANNYQLGDAIQLLKEINSQAPDQSLRWNDSSTSSFRSSRKRRRADIHIGEPQRKKRRISSDANSSTSFIHIGLFRLKSINEKKLIKVGNASLRLLKHLQENLDKFTSQDGKLRFSTKTSESSKVVCFPDLSWEAVKSYVVVTTLKLAHDGRPPGTKRYKLAKRIPTKEDEQKELMIQVAQMACTAIRLKFDEDKIFSLLDWHKARMKGLWEELFQSGNEFVREIVEARERSIHCDFTSNRMESKVGLKANQNIQSLDQCKRESEDRNVNHSSTDSYNTIQRFHISSSHSNSFVTVAEREFRLFTHLKINLDSLDRQNGKLDFSKKKGTVSKTIKLYDLSLEAIQSFVEVVEKGLSSDDGPPCTVDYELKRVIPSGKEDQKELMSQVAQMVCVAIRFKYDEMKLFVLLDWYNMRMGGVWETLLQCGNEFVEEVEEARKESLEQFPTKDEVVLSLYQPQSSDPFEDFWVLDLDGLDV